MMYHTLKHSLILLMIMGLTGAIAAPAIGQVGRLKKKGKEAIEKVEKEQPSSSASEVSSADTLKVTREQAQTDAEKLLSLHQTYYEQFQGIYGGNAVGETTLEGTLRRCEEVQAQLETLEQDIMPVLQPFMASFADKYGMEPGDIDWKLKQLGVEVDGWPGTAFRDLHESMGNVIKTRQASAEYLADYVKNMPEADFFDASIRVEKLLEWKTVLQWALTFDPNNAYANERLAKIDQEMAEVQQAIDKEIDEKTWAGSVNNFSGPGTTGGLAQAALDYFRKDEEWGQSDKGVEVLAVSVRGAWQVAERDVFGRVIRWRLPIHIAITKPDLKEKNVARVYELSAVTIQGAPNHTAKAPPYDGYWVGNSWMMRLDKVPRQ